MPLINDTDVIFIDATKTSVIELTKVDLIHSEEHALKYKATNFPVEDGSNVSDNVTKEPEELTLRGITANASLLGSFLSGEGTLSRVHDAWQQIKQLADNKQQVTVVTIVHTYNNMTITSASIPTLDKNTGQNLIFALILQETPVVITSDSQITSDKTSSTNNPAKNMPDQINNGDKQTTNNDVDQSTLDRLI